MAKEARRRIASLPHQSKQGQSSPLSRRTCNFEFHDPESKLSDRDQLRVMVGCRYLQRYLVSWSTSCAQLINIPLESGTVYAARKSGDVEEP